jgi:hypothetical protein
VLRFDACSQPLPVGGLRSSTHAFGVSDAVELARALGRLPDRLDVYVIEGENFTAGERLKPRRPAGRRRARLRAQRLAARTAPACDREGWALGRVLTQMTFGVSMQRP